MLPTNRDSLSNIDLEIRRQLYAEEVRAVGNIQSEAVVRAFAKVPREQFLGPGPWKILNPWYQIEASVQPIYYRNTPDSDPTHLYHNVLVGIDPKRNLNNGEPAFLGFLIDSLDLDAGAHVLHVGCGTGYYSAILAEVVGPQGHVTAIEIDSELAAIAKSNLAHMLHVSVIHGDGSEIDAETNDAILVNAGATHPRSCRRRALRTSSCQAPHWCYTRPTDRSLRRKSARYRGPSPSDTTGCSRAR